MKEFFGFITPREILSSIIIFCICVIIGVGISAIIYESYTDETEKYNKAVKIENTELFQYSMDTNIGNGFVYGEFIALDPVSFSNIKGKYMSLTKKTERYTQHSRVVSTSVNGKPSTKVETYYSWDTIDTQTKRCKKVKFCGVTFDFDKIGLENPKEEFLKTKKISSKIRERYYGSPVKTKGTIFSNLKNSTIDNSKFYYGTIEEVLDKLNSKVGLYIFWLVWILISLAVVFIFCYTENKWLY